MMNEFETGSVDRANGQGLHPVRPFQQRERVAIARLFREDGTGERLELSRQFA